MALTDEWSPTDIGGYRFLYRAWVGAGQLYLNHTRVLARVHLYIALQLSPEAKTVPKIYGMQVTCLGQYMRVSCSEAWLD